MHTFSTLSLPFIFLDRLLYDTNGLQTEEELSNAKQKAQSLFELCEKFVQSLGLTILIERPVNIYTEEKLHRSTSGATFNKLRIPSCTIELGPMKVALPTCRDAGIKAVLNGLIFSQNVVDVAPSVITEEPVLRFENYHRYLVYPQANATGICDFQLVPGSPFKIGDVLVIIRAMDGQVVDKVIAEFDGYCITWVDRVTTYAGQSLGMVAVDDQNSPTIISWQELTTKK